MNNFTFCNPTKIIFGRGTVPQLAREIPAGQHVLLLYGGGSIHVNGVYAQVTQALKNHRHVEFGGIEPNPLYETAMKAVALCREKAIDYILAVGGGSVIDAAKFIAAAAKYTRTDAWEILTAGGRYVESALPLGTVLTLPATGTESNGNSVISRAATQEKLAFASPHVFPRFSVLDPETTFSLPAHQVRNGVVDAFVHVCEQYATAYAGAPLQDRFCEAIIQTLIECGAKTIHEPRNYDVRADFMWSATMALNTLIGMGKPQDWSTHMIGHELTAFYGIAHAESLAIVMPGVWRAQLESKRSKLEQYGQRVWGVNSAEEAIRSTEQFFESLGMPTRLSAHRIDANEAAARIQQRFEQRGVVWGEDQDITPVRVAAIIRSRA